MAAAESDTTVMLTIARAQAAGCLSACDAALGRAKDENEAARATAMIVPLREAVALLGQAVAASVGGVAQA